MAAKSAEAESSATAPANKPKATDAKDAVKADQSNGSAAKASEPAAQAGTPRSVTFTYKITESGVVAGVTNDTATKTVSFKVTDDGNGKLTVARVAPADESSPAFAFTNTYSVKPVSSSVTDQITVTKQLTGRDLETGEFSFELVEGSNIVATATNDAAGNVTFDALTYQKPGEHHYLLREVGAGTQQAGVQYDSTVFDVATTVTDNGDGTLSVVHKLGNGGNAAKFANTYQPASTSVVLGATKVLTGKSLAAGEFMFELTGDDGMRATAENDGAGGVSFPAQEYTEKGTYHYLISEVKGNEAGVTYDDATYPVTVTVDDNGKGTLVAAVSYDDGNAPVFHNSYEKPESPLPFVFGGSDNANGATASSAGGSSAVKTGDGALALAAVIAAVAALAIGVGALAFGRRRRR